MGRILLFAIIALFLFPIFLLMIGLVMKLFNLDKSIKRGKDMQGYERIMLEKDLERLAKKIREQEENK